MTRPAAHREPHRAWHAALCPAFALLLLAPAASQAQSSPYFIGLSQQLGHDDNLLRLGENEVAPPSYSKADSFSTTSLLAGFNQAFGRQRASANVSLRDTRYERNSVFNNQGYNVRGGLDWSTAERVAGSINFSANRSLQRFNSTEIGFVGEKNLENVRALNFRVSAGLITEYSLELTGGRTEVRNSLQRDSVQAREFNQENVSLGLRWSPSSLSSIGLALGNTRGRYPKFRTLRDNQQQTIGFEADRFKRDDVELSISHRPSGASKIEARLSSGKTVYDLNAQRNFSGLTGNLVWTWQPTGKLVLTSAVTRDTGQESYATSFFTLPAIADYSRDNNVFRVLAEYSASAKVAVTGSILYYRRNVVRTIDNPFLPLEARGRDKVTLFNLGVRWAPIRTTLFGCDLAVEDRRAEGELVVSLKGNTFSCYGQLTLQ